MGAKNRNRKWLRGQSRIPSEVQKQCQQMFEQVLKLKGLLNGDNEALLKLIEENKRQEREHMDRL